MNFHLLLSVAGRYLFFNKFFEEWSGYHLDEVSQKHFQDHITGEYAHHVQSFLKKPSLNKTLHLPRVAFMGKNSLKWIEVSLSYVPVHRVNYQVIVSISDVQDTAHNEINEVLKSHASFFEGHPFGVLHLNKQGEVTRQNSQIETEIGYKLNDLQLNPLLSYVVPKHKKTVLLRYTRASRLGKSATLDIEIVTARRQQIHVNLTIIPVVYHGETIEIYLVLRNITERKILQRNLKKLSLVADKTTNGVMVLNRNFEIELINDGFTQMSGFTRDDAIGRGLSEVLRMANENKPTTEEAQSKLSAGTSMAIELQCKRKDGTSYWNMLKLTPIMNDQGQMDMCITIHTDITDKKKSEMELRLLADDLYRQNKELHQFAYIVSHNMRSPVANIVGLANLMEVFKDDPETQTQTLKELSKSVNNLDMVIKDLSYILTVNNANKELLKEPVKFHDLLQQVLIDLQPQITHANAEIHVPVKPLVIRTNRAYLHSIFYNLISNALKYRSLQIPYIKIDFYLTDEHTVIYVADNGKGINLDKHSDDMFKPYKRFDFKVEGKGLGLFLVKSHIEALGGQLNVKSEVSKGSTFYIKIPHQ
jgi:PAS domain S-box-containing protein